MICQQTYDMPLLAVGRLCLEHVFCMLDAIKKHSKPLQVARKDGKIWSFLYVSYQTESCMRQALDDLQQYVKDTWGLYSKGRPFLCAAADVGSLIFPVFIKDTPVGMHATDIVKHFERDTDLLAWNEIEVVRNLGGFFVNFIDFEDAMKYVRRSERRQLFVQGRHTYARPQKNLVVALKLFAQMQNTSQTCVSIQDIRDVWLRFGKGIGSTQLESAMVSLYTVFEKVTADVPSTEMESAVFYRLRADKEVLLQTYSMHRIQQLESKMDGVLPGLRALFQGLLCTISVREGLNEDTMFDNTSHAMKRLLQECTILLQNNCTAWKTSQLIVCLCTETIRDEMKAIPNIAAETACTLWGDSPRILPQLLADENLISYKKIRCSGYREMLQNPKGNLVSAMKALHICLYIVTWNAYVSLPAFECLCTIIEHSNDVVVAAVQGAFPADV